MSDRPARPARDIAAFSIGDRAQVRRVFSLADVARYAELSGDFNELHVDADYAAGSRFGGQIVHGMLTASLLSRLIGMELPGRGAIYLQQQMRFTAPVFPGDEVEATVEVIAIDRARRRLTLATTCRKLDGTVVLTGEALVQVEPPAGER